MANLYEIQKEIEELLYQCDEDGVFLPGVAEQLEELYNKQADKYDNIGKLIKNLEADILGYDSEIARFTDKKMRSSKKIEHLKKYVSDTMIREGKDNVDGNLFSFSFRTSKATNIKDMEKLLIVLPEELIQRSIKLNDYKPEYVEVLKDNGFNYEINSGASKTEVKKWYEMLPEEEQEKYSDVVEIEVRKNLQIK